MPETFDPKELDARLSRADPDRAMAARFASAEGRERLIALYAFNLEVARVWERVTEPMIGDMRLAWWREAIEEIYDPYKTVRWQEAARALQDSFGDRLPPRLWLDRLVNIRARDLNAEPFTSLKEVRDYAEASGGTLMRAAVWLLAPDLDLSPDAEKAVAHAGIAWALTGLLRAIPFHAEHGGQAVHFDLRDLAGAAGEDSAEPVLAMARDEYRIAKAAFPALPPECAPACLYAALIPAYLKRLSRTPPRTELSHLSRQVRLVAASARGRI